MKLKKKRLASGIVALVLVLLICIFLPDVVSLGWHAFHGNSVQVSVWDVPVPWGWWPVRNKDTLMIQRMPRLVPSGHAASEVILTPLKLPVGSALDHDKWEQATIEVKLSYGYRFVSERESQLDGETNSCLVFEEIHHPELRWIDCAFPIHRLSIGYMGEKADAQMLEFLCRRIKSSR